MTLEQINKEIQTLAVTDDISDGYHTFGELYEHRIVLYITLIKMIELSNWVFDENSPFNNIETYKSKYHSDGSTYEGWFLLGMITPEGQISYHLPNKYWNDIEVTTLNKAPEYDGHTSQDVLDRLIKLVK